MLLADFLNATVGPRHAPRAYQWTAIKPMLATLSPAEREALLVSFDRDQAVEIDTHRRKLQSMHAVATGLRELCATQVDWTAELVLHALAASRQLGDYAPLGGEKTLRAMQRSTPRFPKSARRDREFSGFVDHLGDVGEEGRTRRAAYALFGEIYAPALLSSHGAISDQPFQRYLGRLAAGLGELAALRERLRRHRPAWFAMCREQALPPAVFDAINPPLHPRHPGHIAGGVAFGAAGTLTDYIHWQWGFAFRSPELAPIDAAWIARHAEAYRCWEAGYGDRRWIEHRPPPLPEGFPANLAERLARTAVKPSQRWIAEIDPLVATRPEAIRGGVLTMLRRFGSADDVRASEAAWQGAAPYAALHLGYDRRRKDGIDAATERLPDLLDLPWIEAGHTVMPQPIPHNPMTVSDANAAFARGLAWVAARWRDSEAVTSLAHAATGAAAPIAHPTLGPRTRSLTIFTACVRALAAIGGSEATSALASLKEYATDPRAARALVESR